MTKIILYPNESVEVQMEDSDGTIKVAFNSNDITVESDLPDAYGRTGVIYKEVFGRSKSDLKELVYGRNSWELKDGFPGTRGVVLIGKEPAAGNIPKAVCIFNAKADHNTTGVVTLGVDEIDDFIKRLLEAKLWMSACRDYAEGNYDTEDGDVE